MLHAVSCRYSMRFECVKRKQTWRLLLERDSPSSLEVSWSSLLRELTLACSEAREDRSSCSCPIRLPIASLLNTHTHTHTHTKDIFMIQNI